MSGRGLTRRQWLRASGAAGLLFPYLRPGQVRADGGRAPGPALVLLMQANGTSQPHFWPSSAGTSRILEPLLGDRTLAAATTVLKGIVHAGEGSGNEHDKGFAGLFSGHPTQGPAHDPWGGGPSLDQVLRTRLALAEPFPTLNCGVLATNAPPFKSHRASFSYLAARQPIPCEVDPYKLYTRLFAAAQKPAAGEDAAVTSKRRLGEKRSVLDHLLRELGGLRSRASAFDRRRLDAHSESLRQMERRLQSSLLAGSTTAAGARCWAPDRPPEGLDVRAEENVPALTRLMLDLVALALACQLTRVVTFQLGHSGEVWYYRWLGLSENSHDDIAHRDSGNDRQVSEKMVAISRWHATQVAYLGRALAALPDTAGTALDRTLVVWGNEVATGPHSLQDIPVVLVGGAAGRLRRPGLLVDEGPQDHRRLGTSLLQVMGVPANGFGDVSDCGPLAGLAVAPPSGTVE